MSNFDFVPETFAAVGQACQKAERQIKYDPRAACFYSRFALESLVHWLYRHDTTLSMPYDNKLGALLYESSFRQALPERIWQKARAIQKVGNLAVHDTRPIEPSHAVRTVKELFHLCYWLVRTYATAEEFDRDAGMIQWQEARIPDTEQTAVQAVQAKLTAQEKAKLQAREAQLVEQQEALLREQQARDKLDAELQALRSELANIKAANEQRPDTHDYNEAETRAYLIDLSLLRAGWDLSQPECREYEVSGMPTPSGKGKVDYVLWGEDGKPLAAVEAKRTTVNAEAGQQQARLYADCLEQKFGVRPIIFYTNGYETYLWDDHRYPPRLVSGFYTQDELHSLILRRQDLPTLTGISINKDIVGRPYQEAALKHVFLQFAEQHRKALLVMATGSGKTRTAIALVDVLQRAGWVKRTLFLADRRSLVKQAVGAFKTHLPDSSPVNLLTEKDTSGRVYASTYPTMMGLIDQRDDEQSRFGVGHFDLIIIDEAHRSVYQKYKAIFEYFDGLLVGLTATPREEIDRNTYGLFDIEDGVPTYSYELEEAITQGYLVPPKVQQVEMQFPREGITYDDLNEAEKLAWESLDWGDAGESPDQVPAAAINNWLFNTDTVDKMIFHLMEHGHKVDSGERLAKTIIFARNHDHAVFIEQRFNKHYPKFTGVFARVIDNYINFAETLIEDFSKPEHELRVAISVDMLDTGIDIPEVANLVFFKPVYSKTKFWQMIGRGTRLCPDLFAPGEDKEDFRIFDFCFNFDFFRENPEGIESRHVPSLSEQLFAHRVQVLAALQTQSASADGSGDALQQYLAKQLLAEVTAMNTDNFLVRRALEAVERFSKPEAWQSLSDEAVHDAVSCLSTLPSELPTDDLESRRFDMTMYKLQLAFLQGNVQVSRSLQEKVIEIAALLEEKRAIPAVKQALTYLAAIQSAEFWVSLSIDDLESLRQRLRILVPFLDKQSRQIVYTAIPDKLLSVREEEVVYLPKMTGVQYEKKVKSYLHDHLEHDAIQKLQNNLPIHADDIDVLQKTLQEIGEQDGNTLLAGVLDRYRVPSVAHLVRRVVGLNRAAAEVVFAEVLADSSLTANQIRFVETIIDQLTTQGLLESKALYEAPFTALHIEGPESLFAGKEAILDSLFSKIEDMEPIVLR